MNTGSPTSSSSAANGLPDPHRSNPKHRSVLCRAGHAEPVRRLDGQCANGAGADPRAPMRLHSYRWREEAHADQASLAAGLREERRQLTDRLSLTNALADANIDPTRNINRL